VNKRAQIPTMLLFLVALILSISTLFAFASFKDDLTFQSIELNKLTEDINFNQKYAKEQTKIVTKEALISCDLCDSNTIKEDIQRIALERKNQFFYEGVGNLYLKINDEIEVTKSDDNIYEVNIPNLFVKSQADENKIKRNFDICMLFDSSGNYQSDC